MTYAVVVETWQFVLCALGIMCLFAGVVVALASMNRASRLMERSARPISEKSLEAAWQAFTHGPPGVVRRMQNIDSYPGEYEGDPEAHNELKTTIADERQALREAVEAAIENVEKERSAS